MPGPASLRAGFDYQDLVAIREIMHLLRHPEQVNVIELEADEVGSFDDVRVQYTSGSERRLQVKFAVDPADEWTWDALMEVPGPTTTRTGRPRRARPLLYKWFDSLRDGPETAVGEIITNRRPAPDLARALGSDVQILFDTIPSEVRTDLVNRYGDVEARSIATRLRFHLEQLGLEELEAQVKRDFADIVNSAAYPQF